MPVRTAVIPAAGLGTRILPATKAIPKELLAIVDKPMIQLVVEEAVGAGVTEVVIVTGPGKPALEEHFTPSPRLEAELERKGKTDLLAAVRRVNDLATFTFVMQSEPLGLGHAVLCAKDAIGDEPFAVLLAGRALLGAGARRCARATAGALRRAGDRRDGDAARRDRQLRRRRSRSPSRTISSG